MGLELEARDAGVPRGQALPHATRLAVALILVDHGLTGLASKSQDLALM